jgi:hypothetical protein
MVEKIIYTRRDIIEIIYSEYPTEDPHMKGIIRKCVLHFIKMNECDFIEYIKEHAPFILERLRRNTYYLR